MSNKSDEVKEAYEVDLGPTPVFRFVIFAWLPGTSHMKRLAMEGDNVLVFPSEQDAWDYYVDFMTPDWECEVVPFPTLSMATADERNVRFNLND